MLRSQGPRVAALAVCLAVLFGLFVLGGAGWPASTSGPGVDVTDPAVDPADEPGAHVETGGLVVALDPVVVELEQDDGTHLHVEVVDAPDVEVGQYLLVDGRLTQDGAIDANPDRAVTREPWEVAYMYLISVVAVLGVAVLGVDTWRFDRRTLSFEPRDRPRHREWLDARDRAGGQGGTDRLEGTGGQGGTDRLEGTDHG